jgi:hypothetical protein
MICLNMVERAGALEACDTFRANLTSGAALNGGLLMVYGDWTAHRSGMWLSRRRMFRRGDQEWDDYIVFIDLPHLHEVRSIDGYLNKDLDGTVYVHALDELEILLTHFEPLEPETQYFQLLAHQSLAQPALADPSRFRLLGYDLSDETHTSSLLNCGPWTGVLAPLTLRLNQYGLLTLADAQVAQALLPSVWCADPHAVVEIWALFEVLVQ